MLLTRLFSTAALVAASLLPNIARADSFTYAVANHFTNFQVDGAITTDTDSGTLTFDNITNYYLLITTSTGSEVLSAANAANAGVYGYALTATAAGLFFDYDAVEAGLFFNNQTTGTYLCFQTFGCDSGYDPHQSVSLAGGAPQTEVQSGLVQIATAVAPTPEPSSLVLLGTGALGIFSLMRRRLPTA